MIIGIVAIAKNFAIGKDGKLPWHYPSDLKFFKATTTGNAVVMGSNTWRSIGKPLPSRLNIVLTRSSEPLPAAVALRSPDDVIAIAAYLRSDTFIIGGANTYQTFSNQIEKWIVTEVPIIVDDADTFMPEDFLENFTIDETEELGEDLVVKTFLRI